MTCQKCQADVPDESAFCLRCGARLAPVARPIPINGSGHEGVGRLVGSATPTAESLLARAPVGRHAYTLSFRPLLDERLRYRVAKWVVERAPAHALGEVQEGLLQGTFLTFLALTPEEAQTARHGIEGLGVASTLVRLAPATAAEIELPVRRETTTAGRRRPMGRKEWGTLFAAVVGLFLFGLVVVRLFGGRGF